MQVTLHKNMAFPAVMTNHQSHRTAQKRTHQSQSMQVQLTWRTRLINGWQIPLQLQYTVWLLWPLADSDAGCNANVNLQARVLSLECIMEKKLHIIYQHNICIRNPDMTENCSMQMRPEITGSYWEERLVELQLFWSNSLMFVFVVQVDNYVLKCAGHKRKPIM